jgi:hypothetical protein
MNPNVPQEVRIINAISEQLFNSWPVSIIMIDLEDCIWRLNQQVMNEYETGSSLPPCQKGIRTYSHGNHQQYYHHGCQSTTLYRQHSDKGYSRESRF